MSGAKVSRRANVPGRARDLGRQGRRRGFAQVVTRNAEVGVTWLHSYLSEDKQTMVCVYEGPESEAIRTAAELNGLPIDRITRVLVLDPHLYR